MGRDKKRGAGRLRFVLLRAPGDPLVSETVPLRAVAETLSALSAAAGVA
jgi:3-dehydroquinate synthetase